MSNFTLCGGHEHKTTTSFFFPWTSIQSFRLQSRRNWQYLTNWTRWNKHDKVWSSATSLFKWRFRNRLRRREKPCGRGCLRRCCLNSLLGTLRCEDGNGRENVAEKVNSPSFNLHRDYFKSLTLWNVGEPSKGWIPKNHIQVQKEGGNFVVACVLPLYNVKFGIFTSWLCTEGKEMYKKTWCTRKIVLLVIKPIAFVMFSLPSPSSDRKVPNN